MSKKTPGITILTPPGILSYPNLFEPRAFEKQEPKYSASLLIAKSRATELKPLMDAIVTVATAHFGPDFGKKKDGTAITLAELFATETLVHPVKDGDKKRALKDPAYAGMLHFQASTDLKHKPVVVGPDGQPLMSPDEIYAGVLARMRIYVCPFEFGTMKKGVTLLLNGVQKMRDGERLDGRVTTFDPVEPDADPMA